MFLYDEQLHPSDNTLRGPYLQILTCSYFDNPAVKQYRAVVRTVTVVPFGNFSAVSAINIGGKTYRPIYGAKITVPYYVYVQALVLPDELYEAAYYAEYSSERREELRVWAQANVKLLSKPIRGRTI